MKGLTSKIFVGIKAFCERMFAILQNIFAIIFTEEQVNVQNLHNQSLQSWRAIAHLQIQEDGTLFIFHYENKVVKDAILRIKNKHDVTLAQSLVSILADFLLEELSEREMMTNFTHPLVVAIPSSTQTKNKRGFNPSELLAETLGKIIPTLSFLPHALMKIKQTKPQKELSRTDRLTNVKHSMIVNQKISDKIKDRCVIILDDITTTGATLAEARRALLAGGAREVLCVALVH